MKGIPFLLFLLACREARTTEAELPVAFSLSGAVGTTGDVSELGFGTGDVSIFLRQESCTGEVFTVARNVVRDYTASELQRPLNYAFDVLEAPGAAYPVDLYPVAVFVTPDGAACAVGCGEPIQVTAREAVFVADLSMARTTEPCPR